MVCTAGQQKAKLEVAAFDPSGTLGPARVLVDGCLCGSPAWSPDSATVAFLASTGQARHFQLWSVPAAPAAVTPAAAGARQLTSDLDFDATSPPAWF